jgi:hypothetical protein
MEFILDYHGLKIKNFFFNGAELDSTGRYYSFSYQYGINSFWDNYGEFKIALDTLFLPIPYLLQIPIKVRFIDLRGHSDKMPSAMRRAFLI